MWREFCSLAIIIMINETKLPYLLKLLDDKEPITQAALKAEFADSTGDLSNELTALGLSLIHI